MEKQNDKLSWNDYFMELAKISAKRSKDPNTQVGACIIDNKNRILGIGYNGFPRGCGDNDFPWTRPQKYLYVCHAEVNAILNSTQLNLIDGAILYTTLFPCNECTKLIIQVGIKKIIYLHNNKSNKEEYQASLKMLEHVGIELIQYQSDNNSHYKDIS